MQSDVKVALIVYIHLEPDINAWNTGSHMGNPNMPTGAYGTTPAFVQLIPDHPMAEEWMDWLEELWLFTYMRNLAPGGGYGEYGTYGLHGYKNIYRGLMGFFAADRPGNQRLENLNESYWRYTLDLISPHDPLYKTRIIPGDANSHPEHPAEFIEAPATLAGSADQLGAELNWAWLETGANRWDVQLDKSLPDQVAAQHVQPLLARPWLQPAKPDLKSSNYPGVGTIFRSDFGQPNEGYAYFRSGFAWSHWNANQSHIVFYANETPLIPGQPYQYYGRNRNNESNVEGFSNLHENVVAFGHPRQSDGLRLARQHNHRIDFHRNRRLLARLYRLRRLVYNAWSPR